MKILFVNPPAENIIPTYPNEDGEAGMLEADDYGHFPPLGILYVATHLEKNTTGHEIRVEDCVCSNISHTELETIIGEFQPDIVGVTSFTISMVDACLVARSARRILPKVHICLGGHHPIAFPREAAKIPDFDSIVVGEGEECFTELVNCLEQNKPYSSILGVYTRESMKEWEHKTLGKDKRFLNTVTVPPAYVDDLSTIPIPNRRYIAGLKYQSILGVSSNLMTIITSRGCPYLCTFCDVPYKKYRERSAKDVVDEIEECMNLGYDEFHFYDDLFNVTKKKVIAFCDEIESRNLQVTWDFRGRVNKCDKETLARAKRAGCRMISFGVETGTDEGLKILKKSTTIAKIEQTFRYCRELGIITVADFIIGFGFEKTEKDIKQSVNWCINLDPDYAQFNILQLLPNTPIFDEGLDKGLVDLDKWLSFAQDPKPGFSIDHWTEHLTLSQLRKLQTWAYRRFYLRKKYIIRSIRQTSTIYQFKTKFRGMLTVAFGQQETSNPKGQYIKRGSSLVSAEKQS